MSDTLEIFGVEYTGVTGIVATDDNDIDQTYIRPQGTKSITANGTGIDVVEYASVDVSVPSSQPSLQSKTKTYIPTTNQQTETVTADNGYDGLSGVNITVNAMPSGSASTPATTITANPTISVNASGLITATTSASKSITPSISAGYVSSGTAGTVTVSGSNTSQLSTQAATTITPTEEEQTAVASGKYTTGIVKVGAISSDYIGSNISRKSSTDLTVSGNTVTASAGYYESAASKSVASGTAGTPTATKGTVSNHSVSVTPSVTNTTGYITGGTKTGAAVTVSASELVSGTKSISANGAGIDVTNYASVNVNVDDSTFVVTMSWDSSYGSTGAWVPNKTWAQISAAATAGKTIVAEIDNSSSSANSSQIDDDSRWITSYGTYEYTVTSDYGNRIEYMKYVLVSTGEISLDTYDVTYNTSTATATVSDVASGKTFYNSNGVQTGSLSFVTYYTGSSTPASSLGSNGDIYLKTV